MNEIIVIKIQHYNGKDKPWNKAKEFKVNKHIITQHRMGNEQTVTHWIDKQRIVLKSSWDEQQLKT